MNFSLLALRSKLKELKLHHILLLWLAVNSFLFILVRLLTWLFPHAVPFSMFYFWSYSNIWAGIKVSWPILLWATSLTLLVSIFTKNKPRENFMAESLLKNETATSIMAGVFEEMCFRWLNFFFSIITIKFFNIILLGIPKFLYLKITAPIINLVTFGKVKWLLFNPAGWFVGAGAVGSNAKFRDGHKYQGVIGVVNAWFIGFFMFWLIFKYGLLAAIVVHALYDIFIAMIRYVDRVIERRLLISKS